MGKKHIKKIQQFLVNKQFELQDLTKKKYNIESLKQQNKEEDIDLNIDSNFSINIKEEETKLLKQEKILKKDIRDLENLEMFAKKIDDTLIVSYVDGHLTFKEYVTFEKYISFEISLKKEIDLMKKANSFFGKITDDYKEPDPSILKNILELIDKREEKKNSLNLAKPKIKTESLITKIKDFITFKPMDFGFAGIVPVVIGVGFLYGTNGAMIASNPALIQLSQLSSANSKNYLESIANTFPGSKKNDFRDGITKPSIDNCILPEILLEKTLFNKYFKIKVTNPKTKNSYILSDRDKILAGNIIEFNFNYNEEGTFYVDNIVFPKNDNITEQSDDKINCKITNLLSLNHDPRTNNKISEKYSISEPWNKEKIIISFKNKISKEKNPIGILSYQPTTLENFDKKFINIEWKKNSNVQILKSNGLYKLHSNVFKKSLYAPYIKSWKNKNDQSNNSENIYIDFDGDNKADIIAFNDKKNNIKYYVLDTNDDSRGDILVYPKIENTIISYEWLIDTNYDGQIDQMAVDADGNWKIDKTKDM